MTSNHVNRLRGILFDGASGEISNNDIRFIRRGVSSECPEGNAVEVRNFGRSYRAQVKINSNSVTAYQAIGILVNGDMLAQVEDNTIVGDNPNPTGSIEKTGIQFSFGATGSVRRNSVNSNWYAGNEWISIGIKIFEANDVTVVNNNVLASQYGVSIECWAWIRNSADGNQIVNNDIRGSAWGISVETYSFRLSNSDVTANNNTITANTIWNEDDERDTGIFVGGATIPPSTFLRSTENTNIHGNKIIGFATAIKLSGDSGTHANGNRISPP